ncbi:Uncharacterised protein [Klebsiella aerogenes]|nr:Uncharacterised protein [Klebsiella aerogenes]
MNPIITAHQEIVIENSVRYIELLKSEATKILDEYWENWKARNQLISQTTYANGGKFMPGRFARCLKRSVIAKADNCMERFFAQVQKQN